MAELQSALGLDGTVELTASELGAAAQKGTGVAIPGLGGATLATALVNGSRRLEIRNYRPEDRERLKAHGVFSEVIQRSEEHTSELQSLMRISYAVFCLKTKK